MAPQLIIKPWHLGETPKKKSIRWNLLTFWEASEPARPWIRFSPHNKTIRKPREQKMVVCVCVLLTGKEHEANQCAISQSSIRGEMPPEDNLTESHSWQMIFICNVMDYKCHNERIIMLLFTIMKEGQSTTHLCLLKSAAFLCWARSSKRSNMAQWSLDELSAIGRAALTVLWFTAL